MNSELYPIYVINLRRAPERKLHVQRQLDALGLSCRFIDAVDKYNLESSAYRTEIAHLLGVDAAIIEREYTPYFYNHLACTLSHVKAYNLMIEHNDSVACILEDDIVISPNFPEILRATRKIPWDILMLSSHSRTIRYIAATNPTIQESIEKSLAMDCSLFPRLRKTKWFRRLLPPTAVSQSQLDWTSISKLEWCLLILLSYSRTCNNRCKYFINAYKYLLKLYNPKHHILYKDREEYRRLYAACKIGGLPIRSSQQTLYGDYDIGAPAEQPTSAMAYLLTLEMAYRCKAIINSKDRLLIDAIPWHLQEKYRIRLRIITPPCVTAALPYLRNSTRML